jgi:heme exporter protein D
MAEFFHMGGYAFYVWTSYGLALLVLVWVFFMPLRTRKQIIRELRMKYRQQERQQQERKVSKSAQAD